MEISMPLLVKLGGQNVGRRSDTDSDRLVQVELTETDYIIRSSNDTATRIDSRFLDNLFLDVPHDVFCERSRFEHNLTRLLSDVLDLNRDYFLGVVIPETVSFAYDTGFRTIKIGIEIQVVETICDGDACTICLEELTSNDVEIMPCGHVFHKHCARRWLERSDSCPLCREKCFARNRISDLGLKV